MKKQILLIPTVLVSSIVLLLVADIDQPKDIDRTDYEQFILDNYTLMMV